MIIFFQVKYFRDTYAEHPDDRENIEYSVFLDSDDALVTLSGMYEQLKKHGFNLAYARYILSVSLFSLSLSLCLSVFQLIKTQVRQLRQLRHLRQLRQVRHLRQQRQARLVRQV